MLGESEASQAHFDPSSEHILFDDVPPLFPDEPLPGGWAQIETVQQFVRWAGRLGKSGASDIKMNSSTPVSVRVDGQYYPVTRHIPTPLELSLLLDAVTQDRSSSSVARGGQPVDFSFEVQKSHNDRRSGKWRLRGNATGVKAGLESGVSLTFRFIPEVIPELESLNVNALLVPSLFPDHGLVSIAGVMGSGKTTSLAAMVQRYRQTYRRALVTIEDPIEFDFENIPGAMGTIEQLEVPRMVKSFELGIESATRKAADALLVGETRNRATMESMVHAAEIGIAVYHTIHASSVAAIPGRIIHQFNEIEAPGIAVSFLSEAQVMIQQRLYPRVGGGRIALREWLVLDETHRQRLVDTPIHQIYSVLDTMVRKDGRTLVEDAVIAHREGWINDAVLHRIEAEKSR
ncbi:Flp pilus assembly complex ATPase component TadA [Acidithiobacillus thiooxidans]|uniref:type IV pilus twitching motility protein PilT n=1 Tax=Acidithiobacillus thiooxidans TaxID=930 RepID=UPI001C06AB13|nr:ATPase, T2SS/T4P/T4SS family [Acidithiobacillus thiooxidans]MBU2794451.1 Flp pilus assembly complex ATPase component TadA [Acidithiobacillus thiooxidans]